MRPPKASKEHHKAEVKLAEVEAQKKRLKNLIVLGKERGYLTYAEINDHLPDDMTDAEQIEGVVTMLADMGIAVYDEAPDAEQLLMTEAPAPIAEEDVIEEAEAALSTTILAEKGYRSRAYKDLQEEISSELLAIRFTAKQVEHLCNGLRGLVERVRSHEREIMELATKNSNMPRAHFIKVFPGNETNLKWANEEVASGKAYAKALERFKPAAMEQQEALISLQKEVGIPIKDLKEIARQMATVEAKR